MKRLVAALLLFAGCDGRISTTEPVPDGGVVSADCSTSPEPPRRVRRLTRLELETTANSVMQQSLPLVGQLAPDVVVAGFDTLSDALVVTPLLAEQLGTVAEKLAAEVKTNPARFGTTRDAFIDTFGARAFRRPLTAGEKQEYQALYAMAAAEGHPAAAALVAEAMLQSPFYVYRTELGALGTDGKWALTHDELTQLLSYLLTGAPPDDALQAAALGDATVLTAQAERLLMTPAAKEQLGTFIEKWLAIEGIAFVPKSGAQAAGFDETVRASMRQEARAFHAQVFTSGGTYGTLMSPGYSMADVTLTAFYAEPMRGGLLTLGSLLSVYGKATGPAPVQRGEVIRERVLCEELPPPPPNVNAQPPAESSGKTARERFAAHENVASCANCHRRIDPIGFGFENYDGTGRYRATDNGSAIDAKGEVKGLDGADVAFDGVRGLATVLGNSPQARGCYLRQWVRFGLGSDGFGCGLERDFGKSDQPLRAAVLSLVASKGFRFRAGPAVAVVPPNEPPLTFDTPDAGTTPLPAMNGVEVVRKPNSDWATGFCEDVAAKNITSAALDWKVTLAVSGTVNQSWNSTYVAVAGGTEFSGAAWNKTLQPGQTAGFGYCALK